MSRPSGSDTSADDAATSRAATERLPAALAAAAMGVYLVLVAGITVAEIDAPASCVAWPACGGWPATEAGWIAAGHRLAALAVGVGVLAAAITAWRTDAAPRVRLAVGTALALYPVQAALGGVLAATEAPAAVATLHLGLGLAIFGCLLAGLAWRLEAVTGSGDEAVDPAPEPAPPVSAEPAPRPASPAERLRLTARAYLRLTKPRLMWLLCLVALAAMALGAGSGLPPRTAALTLVGGVLAIGASGTFNHVLERDVDRRMKRTADRPLAVDLVSVRNAVAFGLALTAGALAAFLAVGPFVALLGLLAVLFYSVVYTLVLKPNTVRNTVLGGAAGSLPALIGWAAVTGGIGPGGLLLAGLVFLWTPAHFYNLALAYRDDYAKGGFPMMPVVRGTTATRRHIVWYFGATLAAAAALAAVAGLGWLYALTGAALGAAFLAAIVRLHYEQSERAALRAFHASNAFLGGLLVAVIVDSAVI